MKTQKLIYLLFALLCTNAALAQQNFAQILALDLADPGDDGPSVLARTADGAEGSQLSQCQRGL